MSAQFITSLSVQIFMGFKQDMSNCELNVHSTRILIIMTEPQPNEQ